MYVYIDISVKGHKSENIDIDCSEIKGESCKTTLRNGFPQKLLSVRLQHGQHCGCKRRNRPLSGLLPLTVQICVQQQVSSSGNASALFSGGNRLEFWSVY